VGTNLKIQLSSGRPLEEEGNDLGGIVGVVGFEGPGFLSGEDFAVGVEDDENGEAVLGGVAVFLDGGHVAFDAVTGIHIDRDENEVSGESRVDLFILMEKCVETVAPDAPVGAEFEQNVFGFGPGGDEGCGDVSGGIGGGVVDVFTHLRIFGSEEGGAQEEKKEQAHENS